MGQGHSNKSVYQNSFYELYRAWAKLYIYWSMPLQVFHILSIHKNAKKLPVINLNDKLNFVDQCYESKSKNPAHL